MFHWFELLYGKGTRNLTSHTAVHLQLVRVLSPPTSEILCTSNWAQSKKKTVLTELKRQA